jgi:hypothetical protein
LRQLAVRVADISFNIFTRRAIARHKLMISSAIKFAGIIYESITSVLMDFIWSSGGTFKKVPPTLAVSFPGEP